MKNVFIGLAFGLLCGFVGRMDYEDAKAEEALYCSNVKNGVWPDYEGTYKNFCEIDEKALDVAEASK
jgi:hypothetical protein